MAENIFLEMKPLKGESQDKAHRDEIELLSFAFGGSNPASVGTGKGGGVGTVNLSSFSAAKSTDSSSAELFQQMCTGKHFPEAKVTIVKGGGSPMDYLVYEFEEVYIDDISWGGSAGSVASENVSFSFGKVSITYTEQKPDGSPGGDHVGTWDVRTGTP